jgi:hypothetical protein
VSSEHASFFTQNLLAVRIECRMTLTIYRPNAFVYGNLTSSPA